MEQSKKDYQMLKEESQCREKELTQVEYIYSSAAFKRNFEVLKFFHFLFILLTPPHLSD